MRSALILLFAMVGFPALADGWPPASAYTYGDTCDQSDDEKQCQEYVKEFTAFYKQATKGEYKAQTMVAMALSSKMNGIAFRPALACAWSNVVLRSGHLTATPDDTKNNVFYCGKLNAEEHVLAEAQTREMLKLLQK